MKKFIKINLIILVIFCLSWNYLSVQIYAENIEELPQTEEQSENIEENEKSEEKTLDELQIEKSELENIINESNNQIQFIESDLSALVVEISEINQKICDKQLEIETLQAQEKEILAYIKKAEMELEESNSRYEKQKDLLEKRLVAMYEMGENSYLEILLNSKGITEFFSNYYLISEISEADSELLKTVESEKNYNKKLKESLETKKNILTASKETIEKNSISLTNMSIIKNNKIQQLSQEELELQQAIEEYQNQITEIEKEIRVLAIANVSERYVGGTMAWPAPGYTRITSPFGMRTHPITGVYKLHTGVDIGAPYGSNFIAANDGIVIYAGWNNAYGNMVIIDHGGGITTLYAHGSEILVNVGDTVYIGTPVLKVGSTGYSTGAHAHFEVRVNGEYVQPLDYITSYSTANSNNIENSEIQNIENTIENNTNPENNTINNAENKVTVELED